MQTIAMTRLSLAFITGFNDEGEPIFKVKQYRNVEPQATGEQLFETAVAIASLQQHQLEKVERNNTYELIY